MYPVTLPGATVPIDLPTRWGEVTLGQFARLTELPEQSDVYNFLSVFLDLAPLEVMNLPAAFVNEQVLPVLDFAANSVPDFASFTLPRTLHLPGETAITARALPVLPSLDLVTFGQATDLGSVLLDAALPAMQKRLRTLAIVFYPAYVGGAYDSDAIEDFAEQVCSQAALEEALPITDFFEQYDAIRRGHASQLKRIPLTGDEKAAGLEALVEEWDALAVVNALAGGDKTRWPYFWRLPWGEVNTMIEFENHQAYYRYQLHKRQERTR